MGTTYVNTTSFQFPEMDAIHFLLLVAIVGLIAIAVLQGYIHSK